MEMESEGSERVWALAAEQMQGDGTGCSHTSFGEGHRSRFKSVKMYWIFCRQKTGVKESKWSERQRGGCVFVFFVCCGLVCSSGFVAKSFQGKRPIREATRNHVWVGPHRSTAGEKGG